MSTKNCGHTKPCGCEDIPLTTNPPCGDGPECNDPNPCSEVFDAQCIYYTGEPILCETDEVVTSNMSLADAIVAVITYFCNTAEHELPSQLECEIPGEVPVTEIVSPAGSTLDETLQNIVAYFCDKSNEINQQITQLTVDVDNLQNINHSSFVTGNIVGVTLSVPQPNGCVTNFYNYQLVSGGGIVGDTLSFSTTICPTDAICDDAEEILPGDPIPATANILMCDNGDPKLVNADRFAFANAIPSSNAYGLFSQIDTSTPVQGITNNAGSLFTIGVGSLSVPAGTFQTGDAYKLDGAGHLTHPAPPTSADLKIEVLLNGIVEIALSMDMPTITDLHWSMEVNFVVRSTGTGGAGQGQIMTGVKFIHEEDASDKSTIHSATQISDVNTVAVINTLDIRATWNTPADDREIYSEIMNLHKIY